MKNSVTLLSSSLCSPDVLNNTRQAVLRYWVGKQAKCCGDLKGGDVGSSWREFWLTLHRYYFSCLLEKNQSATSCCHPYDHEFWGSVIESCCPCVVWPRLFWTLASVHESSVYLWLVLCQMSACLLPHSLSSIWFVMGYKEIKRKRLCHFWVSWRVFMEVILHVKFTWAIITILSLKDLCNSWYVLILKDSCFLLSTYWGAYHLSDCFYRYCFKSS